MNKTNSLADLYAFYLAPNIKESYKQDERIFRTRYQLGWFLLFFALLVIIPPFLNDYYLYIAGLVGVAIIGASGLNILIGYTGQISMGHAAFMGVGGYAAGLVMLHFNLPFWLAFIIGGLASSLIGLVIGIPSLRIKGIYLAIATVAFQFISEYVFYRWDNVTGGVKGITIAAPSLFGWNLGSHLSFYYILLFFVLALLFANKNLIRSKFGRGLMAVRDNDISAEAIGIPVFKYKLLGFAISSFYAGVAGALFATLVRNSIPDFWMFYKSIEYLAMVIVGGMGTLLGPIVGAAFITLIPEILNVLVSYIAKLTGWGELQVVFAPVKLMIYGVLIIFFLIVEPSGLAGIWRRTKDYFRIWPMPYL